MAAVTAREYDAKAVALLLRASFLPFSWGD